MFDFAQLAIDAELFSDEDFRIELATMRTLVWFRRDLRVADNSALYHAAQQSDDGVIGLFVVTPQQWHEHDDAPAKIQFWLKNLAALSTELEKLNIPLRIEMADSPGQVAEVIVNLAQKHQCQSAFWNREYEFNEHRRDRIVRSALDQAKIAVRQFHDRVVVPPGEVLTKQGKYYTVFTPFRKTWQTKAINDLSVLPEPEKQKPLALASSPVPEDVPGFDFSEDLDERWVAGEEAALDRMHLFCQESIDQYADARDLPGIDGTSSLSPYLAAGVVSPRQCMAAAVAENGGSVGGDGGPAVWISELAWRDFYTHVLVGFPQVSKFRPFKEKTDALKWRTSEQDLHAWQNGMTGYPLVDSGMRQLNRTGWMHNRLRMVTAMFLSKNLLIDWRLGEKYFMEKLIDGDLAANNGGWQWSASTGTDAVPYFRIFNPFSQSKRFDPDGAFIKQMCPELANVPSSALHDPVKLTAAIDEQGISYPGFIVDYRASRERALEAFKSLA